LNLLPGFAFRDFNKITGFEEVSFQQTGKNVFKQTTKTEHSLKAPV